MENHLKRIDGRKRLQKIVFMLQENFKTEFNYTFTSYLYGPYSPQLQNDLDILAQTGYLRETRLPPTYCYKITDRGRKMARKIEKELGKRMVAEFYRFIDELNSVSTEELVANSKTIMARKVQHDIFG